MSRFERLIRRGERASKMGEEGLKPLDVEEETGFLRPFNPDEVDIEQMGRQVLRFLKSDQHKARETVDEAYAVRQVEDYLHQARFEEELGTKKEQIFHYFSEGRGVVGNAHSSAEMAKPDSKVKNRLKKGVTKFRKKQR